MSWVMLGGRAVLAEDVKDILAVGNCPPDAGDPPSDCQVIVVERRYDAVLDVERTQVRHHFDSRSLEEVVAVVNGGLR